eukprot:TRINITY_DN2319_c0_g1_i3.p1 TRINITY_DN2319_c0_g1~~TRINITY_DN2319_c0_g1_i3.p1  ORF type:complete len:756 (+),score=112.63 TRINITY_DN2319_c0_g1_i3:146-2413(+)
MPRARKIITKRWRVKEDSDAFMIHLKQIGSRWASGGPHRLLDSVEDMSALGDQIAANIVEQTSKTKVSQHRKQEQHQQQKQRQQEQKLRIVFDAWASIVPETYPDADDESWMSNSGWIMYKELMRLFFVAWAVGVKEVKLSAPPSWCVDAAATATATAICCCDTDSEDRGTSTATGLTSGDLDSSSDIALLSDIAGDESVLGPDGDVYEIFYPEAGVESLEIAIHWERDDDTNTSNDNNNNNVSSSSNSNSSNVVISSNFDRQVSPAAAYIGNILGSLEFISAAIYPMRKKLLIDVSMAVASVVGPDLERISLVGSAALQIDTPASDIDVVAFTKRGANGVKILHQVASAVIAQDASFKVQVVAATRVPVLIVQNAVGNSLDLSINQSQPEKHLQWFKRRQNSCEGVSGFLQLPPAPVLSEQSLEVLVLRCLKWWLWRRRLPLTKEGGYPSLVWNLMAMHALDCSVVIDKGHESRNCQVLRAVALFFDRFGGQGSHSGKITFQSNGRSKFTQKASKAWELWHEISMDDPAFNDEKNAAADHGTELIPMLSPGTQLLYGAEFRRAQELTAESLDSLQSSEGSFALEKLFRENRLSLNTLPATLNPMSSSQPLGVFFLRGNSLEFGLIRCIYPRAGWSATFLHRRDTSSTVWVHHCSVQATGKIEPQRRKGSDAVIHFMPSNFVALATLSAEGQNLRLSEEDFGRWQLMKSMIAERCGEEFQPEQEYQNKSRRRNRTRNRNRFYGFKNDAFTPGQVA